MIRAVIFDFYSVWLPDRFTPYVELTSEQDPAISEEIAKALDTYYLGRIEFDYLLKVLKSKLDIDDQTLEGLKLRRTDISSGIIDFFHELHQHFLKLGVMGNFGKQEYEVLSEVDQQYKQFEVITGPFKTGAPLLSEDTFASALQALGEPPANCLLISGHQDYLDYAKSLGIEVMAYQGFPKLKEAITPILDTKAWRPR